MTILHTRTPLVARASALLLGLLLAAPALLFPVRSAQAAGVVGDGTPTSCTGAALLTAFMAGEGTISFNCGAAPHTIVLNGTMVVSAGENYTLDGNNRIALDGDNNLQVFLVANGGELTVRNLIIRQANASEGGAIYNDTNGSVTLRGVTIEESGADADRGGAIHNKGLLEVENSFFHNNTADLLGGALYNETGATASVRGTRFIGNVVDNPLPPVQAHGGAIANRGTLTLEGSTLFGNDAELNGGGLFAGAGTLTVVNSTITENTALGQGGGVYVAGGAQVTLTNVTNSRNNADTGGGIFTALNGSISIANTIVADSSTAADDGTPSLNCDNGGTEVTSLGHNLIGDASCVSGAVSGDQINTNPKLSFIADNGGPTETRMPLAGSPAIDKGDNALCPARDQRGVERPQGSTCDIGAVEVTATDGLYRVLMPTIKNNAQ